MKKLPVGIQTFREIIQDGYVYVDKTQYVYSLLNEAKCFFLSRPRRFGKSLLIDTIAEAFSGDRELFKGLHIYDTDYKFEKHPVLRLDMSNIASDTPEDLKTSLLKELRNRTEAEGFGFDADLPSDLFKTLIEALQRKYDNRVVILIDEYDKPILDNIEDIEVAEANRKALRGFYGILKSMDPYLRLTFITGVTKFTKTSIFSGLNNLLDITLSEDYANICGFAIGDLDDYFADHMKSLAALKKFSRYGSLRDEILAWYDGYSWDGETNVLNPFSLLSFFREKKFSSFWYASGTPKFLLDLIKKRPEGYVNLNNIEMGEWSLDSFDILNMAAGPLLFQAGYLTIKEILPDIVPAVYRLDLPNFEVRMAINLHILTEFTGKEGPFAESAYRRLKGALDSGDLQAMLETMKSLFASIPYEIHISAEAYYHSIFYAVMNLLGFDIDAEVSVSGGRIDATLELGDKAYVMEFKYKECAQGADDESKRALFDRTLEDGMKQIKDRGYAAMFEGSGKAIYQAAFAFLGRDDIALRYELQAP